MDDGSEVVRAFIAVEISETARASAAQLAARLKKTPVRVGWVAPVHLHLTLVFLGETFQARVPELARMMDSACAETDPFPYELAGTGYFGSARSPRVIWIGVKDLRGGLEALQRRLNTGVQGLGFKVEDRPFKPHLTLGRVRSSRGADELTSAMASANNTTFGTVEVRRVLLMRSHLEHQGVRYSILHESKLKGA